MLLKLMLDIPSDVYHDYTTQSDGELEDLLSKRLISCVHHTSKKPLYIDDEMRHVFEKLLGKNFSTPGELLDAVRKALTVTVDGAKVALPPILVQRLKTRCFGKKFDEFLKERVVRGLEEYTMMG